MSTSFSSSHTSVQFPVSSQTSIRPHATNTSAFSAQDNSAFCYKYASCFEFSLTAALFHTTTLLFTFNSPHLHPRLLWQAPPSSARKNITNIADKNFSRNQLKLVLLLNGFIIIHKRKRSKNWGTVRNHEVCSICEDSADEHGGSNSESTSHSFFSQWTVSAPSLLTSFTFHLLAAFNAGKSSPCKTGLTEDGTFWYKSRSDAQCI